MSSKSTRQSMTLLCIIAGCLVRIDETNMFSVVKMKNLVRKTRGMVKDIQDGWPGRETGDKDYDDMTWALLRIDEWAEHVKSLKDFHKLPVFAVVCLRCLNDLQTQIKNKQKLRMLKTLTYPLECIHQFIDPRGENMPAYEKADELMDNLYELIEWEWK